MINSFSLNIDTRDVNHTAYQGISEIDLTQGEIKYVKENFDIGESNLQREEKNLENLASVLHSENHEEWMEKNPDKITLNVNCNQDNFGIETKEIATTYDLNLIKEDYSTPEYKDKLSEGGASKSKYSYLKHLSKSNRLHFSHAKAELKLINNVTTCFRFFQQSIHDQKDFKSKFCIHITEDPRRFKYYSCFDYFEFYQIHKTNYNLDMGLAFHDYLTKNETEMFTNFKKFMDPNGKYKGIIDHTIYFLVHKTGHIMTLRTDQNFWGLYSENLCRQIKKGKR